MDNTSMLTQHIKDLELSKKDRAQLIDILYFYNEDKSVGTLVKKLIRLLQPIEYLPLLKDIRNCIHKKHVPYFDKLLNSYLYRSLPPQHGSTNDHRQTFSVATLPRNERSSGLYHTESNSSRLKIPSCRFYVVKFEQNPISFVDFGIFLCDKLENRTGVKVGAVSSGSPASRNGIKSGDYLIELNGISLEKMPLKTVFKILPTLASMRFIIRRHMKPEKIMLTSMNPWTKEKIHPSLSSINGSSTYHNSFRKTGNNRRKLNLSRGSCSSPIGFTIRGGSDFGTSIFVSSVDQGSLADHVGMRIGDCIIAVNGTSFKNITHNDAAQFIRCHLALELTIESTGGIPGTINNNAYQQEGSRSLPSSTGGLSSQYKSAQDLRPTPLHFRDNIYTSIPRSRAQQSLPLSATHALSSTCRSNNSLSCDDDDEETGDGLRTRCQSTGDLRLSAYGDEERIEARMGTLQFEDRWKNFLTVNEYEILKALLTNYKKTKDVEQIVIGIIRGFGINKRLEILNDVRELIREEHIDRFDEIVRGEMDSKQFKSLSYKNSMPASLSKLWFYQPDNEEKEAGPTTDADPQQYGSQQRDSFFPDSSNNGSTPDFQEFSFGSRSDRRPHYTVQERKRPDGQNVTEERNFHHRVKSEADTNKQTKAKKENKTKHKSKSTRNRNDYRHDEINNTDSSFHGQGNWILKRTDQVPRQLDVSPATNVPTPPPRRNINKTFPSVSGNVSGGFESDFSWPDVPEQNNNNKNGYLSSSYGSFLSDGQENHRNSQEKVIRKTYNPSYVSSNGSDDNPTSIRHHHSNSQKNVVHETDTPSNEDRHGNNRDVTSYGRYQSQKDVDETKKDSIVQEPHYKVEVTASRKTGKHLSISGEQHKYRIEPISPSMTIQSVTVHKAAS